MIESISLLLLDDGPLSVEQEDLDNRQLWSIVKAPQQSELTSMALAKALRRIAKKRSTPRL